MKAAPHARAGFTLVELMVTTFIIVLVMGGLGTFFLGAHRLVKGAYAEAELSMQLRLLREKLLFHIAPPHNGKVWAGLLSGANIGSSPVVENSMKVRMAAKGIDLTDGTACNQTIELIPRTQSAGGGTTARWFGNDGDRVDDQWQRPYLRPISSYLGDDWLNESVLSRNLFFITLDATMNGFNRRERLAVPVFGRLQQRTTGGVFHGK